MTEDTLLLKCSCGHSYLQIEKFDERSWGFSLLIASFKGQETPFRRKLHNAWKYLWTGRLESDELILYKDDVQKLLNYLRDLAINDTPDTQPNV